MTRAFLFLICLLVGCGSSPPESPVATSAPKPPPPRTDPKPEGPMTVAQLRDTRYEAAGALGKGDYRKVENLADTVLHRGPEQDWAHHWKAMAASQRGDTVAALKHVQRAIEMGMDTHDIKVLRYEIYFARAEFKKALADLGGLMPAAPQVNQEINRVTLVLRDSPKDPRLYVLRGALLHLRRHYANASENFEQAVKLGDERAHYFRALSLIADDRRPEAIDAINAFLSTQGALPGAEEAKLVLAELTEK